MADFIDENMTTRTRDYRSEAVSGHDHLGNNTTTSQNPWNKSGYEDAKPRSKCLFLDNGIKSFRSCFRQ